MPRRCALAPLAITHLNVLFPQPSRPPLPSGQPPTRRPPRRPPPPSTPRHPPLCRHCRSFSRSLSLIPRLLTTAAVLLPRPLCLPSFRSLPAPGEAAMTRVNLPQTPDRYRRTSASLSRRSSASSFALLPTTAIPLVSLLTRIFSPSPSSGSRRTLQRTFYECWRCMLD